MHAMRLWILALSAVWGDHPAVVGTEFLYETAPFPSCHASTIAPTPTGLIAAWFGGLAEKDPSVGIWVARHDGKAWSKPEEVLNGVQPDGHRLPCWNPVLFRAKDRLLLFSKIGPSPSQWWGVVQTSKDHGKTWSPATRLPDGILGPIKNKPILMGEHLICPSSTEHDGWRLQIERTDDLGLTWSKVEPKHDPRVAGLIQPSLLAPGGDRLKLLCRSEQGKIFASESNDAGLTWSEPRATSLPNPNSGIDAVTLKDGRSLLVSNPVTQGRSPLAVSVSPDGASWSQAVVLEDTPGGEFSYPAIIQGDDGLVHITYTWNRKKIRHVVLDPGKIR